MIRRLINKKGGTKRRNKRRSRLRNLQNGGFLPVAAAAATCIPCAAAAGSSFTSGLLGLGTAGAAIGATKYMSRSSSSSISNGKIKRKEKYEIIKNGKKKKYSINQDNKTVTIIKGKQKRKKNFKTMKQANNYYNKLLKKCNKNKTLRKC